MITVGSRVKITGSDLHDCVGTVLAVRNMSAVAHPKYLVRLDEDNPKHICCGWSIDDMYPNIFQPDDLMSALYNTYHDSGVTFWWCVADALEEAKEEIGGNTMKKEDILCDQDCLRNLRAYLDIEE